jgi:hypothetical protein
LNPIASYHFRRRAARNAAKPDNPAKASVVGSGTGTTK